MNVNRRPALETDIEFARALHAGCYREVVIEQVGGWDPALQAGLFQQKWDERGFEFIELDDLAIGVVVPQWRPDHVFVCEIQIDPAHQGRGIGTRIMDELIAEATSQRLPVRLQALRQSRARRWYERLGFAQTGESSAYWTLERAFDNG
ncbi:MAG: GNAT family N-acetyltransferase [Planctomycetaceae bacterium]|nr:GNAT family N-acetyltransferase [Planctomycetaceae bacterium]